jgi:hypothetical protein
MTLKKLLIYNVIVTIPFGAGLVLIPKILLSLFGLTLDPGGSAIARLFGSALIFVGLLCWFARNAGESQARRAIVLASFLECSLGCIIALLIQLSGILNALGWAIVLLYLSLALWYGYVCLTQTPGSES